MKGYLAALLTGRNLIFFSISSLNVCFYLYSIIARVFYSLFCCIACIRLGLYPMYDVITIFLFTFWMSFSHWSASLSCDWLRRIFVHISVKYRFNDSFRPVEGTLEGGISRTSGTFFTSGDEIRYSNARFCEFRCAEWKLQRGGEGFLRYRGRKFGCVVNFRLCVVGWLG